MQPRYVSALTFRRAPNVTDATTVAEPMFDRRPTRRTVTSPSPTLGSVARISPVVEHSGRLRSSTMKSSRDHGSRPKLARPRRAAARSETYMATEGAAPAWRPTSATPSSIRRTIRRSPTSRSGRAVPLVPCCRAGGPASRSSRCRSAGRATTASPASSHSTSTRNDGLPRVGVKMAAGTGKTVVHDQGPARRAAPGAGGQLLHRTPPGATGPVGGAAAGPGGNHQLPHVPAQGRQRDPGCFRHHPQAAARRQPERRRRPQRGQRTTTG